MQALLYSDWETLCIDEIDEPSFGEGDVLLRVAACGICGSELETFKNRSDRRTPPLVMGHEFCGTVVSAGEGVSSFGPGATVVSNSVVPCGSCSQCLRNDGHLCTNRQIFGMHRAGAFAEFVSVPERCLIEWPEDLTAAQACLAEPLANGIHVFNRVRNADAKTVFVIGVGSIGLMCQQVQQLLGNARVFVSDIAEQRRSVAASLGAVATFDPRSEDVVQRVREMTDGEGVDLVIDAVGSEATKQQSIDLSRVGGSIVWIGLHESDIRLNSYAITLAERTLYGTYAARLAELEQALAMMSSGSVDVSSWVQTFPLSGGVTAFNRMLAANEGDIKAVLVPDN